MKRPQGVRSGTLGATREITTVVKGPSKSTRAECVLWMGNLGVKKYHLATFSPLGRFVEFIIALKESLGLKKKKVKLN